MQLQYCSLRTQIELAQILELQRSNLPSAITPKEQIKEGFVTVAHSLELLKKMNDVCPHTIAKDGNKVVGYALSMHPSFGSEIEVLMPMFDEVRKHLPIEVKYIVMGQICILKKYRGKGIFRNLYSTMWHKFKDRYDCIITEVDANNIRSLNAHHAIGFKDLKVYNSGGQDWYLIILNEMKS